MSTRLGLGVAIAWGMVLVGCRPYPPEATIEGTPQACCTSADAKLQHFEGCRIPQHGCRSRRGERFWMRGEVTCTAVDEARCRGGRCCTYRPRYDPSLGQPIENWAPPGFGAPTNNVTDPEAPPQHELPAPDAALAEGGGGAR